MTPFQDLFDIAARRKGGAAALEALLPSPESPEALARIPDDRWLAGMTKRIFQAGFVWRVIEDKWPGFEAAFEGFEPRRWQMMSDEDLDRLVVDQRIVRNAKKILTVRDNARLLCELAAERGSAAKAFADWPSEDYIGLLDLLKTRGSRLGGSTAQYFLRFMGKDSFMTSGDVAVALIREGVVDKPPTGKGALKKVQSAFNVWMEESGRPLTHISRVLAFTVPGEGEET
ncbi:MAG: DNA-3-methyladenine glycosylase I [Kiloniellales bacterium]|nr:DNA-3-methyladenine glycosylase I [Kiloniellales bacterium]